MLQCGSQNIDHKGNKIVLVIDANSGNTINSFGI